MKSILAVVLSISLPVLMFAAGAQPSHEVTDNRGSISKVKDETRLHSPTTAAVTAELHVADLDRSKFSLLAQQSSASKNGSFLEALYTQGNDYALSMQLTSDGGAIIAGYTDGLGAGSLDVLLIKIDSSGTIQWAKTAGSTGNDLAFSVRQTADGGYIVAGQTDSFNGVGQMLLAKFTSTGAIQWASTLGNASDSAAGSSVQQTTDGGYIVTGFPGGAIGGLGLLKYDSTGQLQWLKRASATNFYGNSVQQTSDGGYIVTGTVPMSGYDLSLDKFDASGNLQWSQVAGGSNYDASSFVQQTSDGGYIVVGTTGSFGAGGQDVVLLKYDSTGTLQWNNINGGLFDDLGDSVQQTPDGGYIVAGHTSGQGAFLEKYDSSGTLQWLKGTGGVSTSVASVQQLSGSGYLIATSFVSAFSNGSSTRSGSHIFVIKTDSNGDVASCGGWGIINRTVTSVTFPSAATSYNIDSPSFDMGSPTLSVAGAKLKRSLLCK